MATVSAKAKNDGFFTAHRVQLPGEQGVLAVQHRLQPFAADKVRGSSVERIADVLVICRNRFGDRGRCFADVKEPAGHLLAGADLGECAVPCGVEIDLQCLLMGAARLLGHWRFHSYHPTPGCKRFSRSRLGSSRDRKERSRRNTARNGAVQSSDPHARPASPGRNRPGMPRPKGTAPRQRRLRNRADSRHRADSSAAAKLPRSAARPTATPTATGLMDWPRISCITSRRCAPMVMRMPISLVRWVTA